MKDAICSPHAAQQLSGRRAVLLFLKRPREPLVRVHREAGDAMRALGELSEATGALMTKTPNVRLGSEHLWTFRT